MTISATQIKAAKVKLAERRARLDLLEGMLQDDPNLMDELVELLGIHQAVNGRARRPATRRKDRNSRHPKKGTQFDAVVKFFKANGNEWAGSAEVMKATDISRGAFSNMVYKAKSDQFETRDDPASGQLKQYRMK